MLEPEQLKELKTRLDALAATHTKTSTELVADLRRDFRLILDLRDSPEKSALEERFIKSLLAAEKMSQ